MTRDSRPAPIGPDAGGFAPLPEVPASPAAQATVIGFDLGTSDDSVVLVWGRRDGKSVLRCSGRFRMGFGLGGGLS